MSRKITFVAVFAVALTLAVDSQAFAKGGKGGGSRGGRTTVRNNRGFKGGRFEHFGHRYGWGYDYATYPVVVNEVPVVEAPVVEAPIVEAPVVETSVYSTYTPVCSTYDYCGYFGGHRGHEFHNHNDHGRTGGRGQGGHGRR